MSGDISAQVNPTLVMAFVKSTKNVLSTMIGLEAKIGKPTIKNLPNPSHDVSGIIGFSGDVMGSVVVSFTETAAMDMVEAFCGERLETTDEDFADAVGELCNMIAGNAKKDFGLAASISVPSVVIGPGHSVARLRDVPCVAIPCQCDVGEFTVEVNIKQVTCVSVGG